MTRAAAFGRAGCAGGTALPTPSRCRAPRYCCATALRHCQRRAFAAAAGDFCGSALARCWRARATAYAAQHNACTHHRWRTLYIHTTKRLIASASLNITSRHRTFQRTCSLSLRTSRCCCMSNCCLPSPKTIVTQSVCSFHGALDVLCSSDASQGRPGERRSETKHIAAGKRSPSAGAWCVRCNWWRR